jgi:hypothetical protein
MGDASDRRLVPVRESLQLGQMILLAPHVVRELMRPGIAYRRSVPREGWTSMALKIFNVLEFVISAVTPNRRPPSARASADCIRASFAFGSTTKARGGRDGDLGSKGCDS